MILIRRFAALALTFLLALAPAASSRAQSYRQPFDAASTGSLAGWTGSASPSGTAGSFVVSASSPVRGTKSFVQANAVDAMVMSYQAGSPVADCDLIFIQRLAVGGSAGIGVAPMIGVNATGLNGYAGLVVPRQDAIAIYRGGATYTSLTSNFLSAMPGVGRVTVDGDLLWTRFRRSGTTIQLKAWLDGNPEPAAWSLTATDATYGAGTFGLRPSGGLTGATLAVDDLAFGDLTLSAPTPYAAAIGNTSMRLRWPPATGGTAAYSYQLRISPHGTNTWGDVGTPTSLLTATPTGLVTGTSYDFEVVATDAASGTSTSSLATASTGAGPAALTYTLTGPGFVQTGIPATFTATPDGTYTGSITVTPSGPASSGLSPTVLTFSGSSPQTFTVTTTIEGSLTLTPTNSAALTNPDPIASTATIPVTVEAFVMPSGQSIGWVYKMGGVAALVKAINPSGQQPTISIDGGSPITLPASGIDWGPGQGGAIAPYLPWCLAPLPATTPARRIFKVGEGNWGQSGFDTVNPAGSYSGRPFGTSTAGASMAWDVEGNVPGDDVDLYVRWPTDATQSVAARWRVRDVTGLITLLDVTVDQSVPTPADATDDGVAWKRLGSCHLTDPNLVLYVELLCSGNKVSADAIRLVRTSADNSVKILSTSNVAISIPAGWATVVQGGGRTGTLVSTPAVLAQPLDNRAGGRIVRGPPSTTTLRCGFNVEPDSLNAAVITGTDLNLGRGSVFSTGIVGHAPVTFDPTSLATKTVGGIGLVEPPSDAGGKGKGLKNAPNGLWTTVVSGAGGDTVAIKNRFNTTVTERVDLASGNRRVFDCQANTAIQFSPALNLEMTSGASAPSLDGTWLWSSGLASVYPPDPSDPTGQTPWSGTPPVDHPGFMRMLAGATSQRYLDGLGTNNQWIHEFADVRHQTQVDVRVLRIEDPGVSDVWFDPAVWAVIKVTTETPHGLYDGAVVSLSACGTATMTAGKPDVDMAVLSIPGGIGLAHVVSPTVVYLQAASSFGGTSKMSGVLTPANGRLKSTWGGGLDFDRLIDRCNVSGSDFYLNIPTCASDDCLVQMATHLAGRLASGRKVRLEYSNEVWNSGFRQWYWLRTVSWRFRVARGDAGIVDDTYQTPGYIAEAAHRFAAFEAAWTGAGRASGDCLRIIGAQGGNAGGSTANLVAEMVAQNVTAHELVVGPYVSNASALNGTEPSLAAIYDRMTAPVCLDRLELVVLYGGWGASFFDAHRTYLDGAGFTAMQIGAYEFAWDTLTPNYSQADGKNRVRRMISDPRMYGITLGLIGHMEDHGCKYANWYYLNGSSPFFNAPNTPAGWTVYDAFDQRDGTGDPSENPDPFAADAVVSQVGGAIKRWNSLLSGAPTDPNPIFRRKPGQPAGSRRPD